MNWLGKLWRKVFRKEVRKDPPPESPRDTYDEENRLIARIGQDFWEVVRGQSKPTVRQIVLTANQAGVPSEALQYVFWILMEQKGSWPSIPRDQKMALLQALRVIVAEDDLPNYRQGFQMLSPEHEEAVQDTIRRLGVWAISTLRTTIMSGYWGIFKTYQKDAAPIMAQRGVPPGKTVGMLRAFFEDALKQATRAFPHGDKLLWHLLQFPG